MSLAMKLLHERSGTGRRAAIVCAVIGSALAIITALVAAHGDAWKAAILGSMAGATLMGAHLTYQKARLWERVASDREAVAEGK